MKLKSLRSRSLVTIFAVVIPVVIVYVLVAYSHVVYQFTQRLDGRMRGELRMLESAVVKSGGDTERLKEAVHLMPVDTFPRRRLFGVWLDGRLLVGSETLPFPTMPNLESGVGTIEVSGQEWRICTSTLANPSGAGGKLRLLVSDSMATRRGIFRDVLMDTVGPLIVAIPLMIVGVYFAVLSSLRPLTRLATQIRDRSAEQLLPIATDDVPSEALPIAESVNNLMARLGESLERERRFTADAAHELRTPLTALKAHAQVALRAAEEPMRREALHSIARTVNRTDRLIAQLLTLARLEPEAAQMSVDVIDLGRVVAQAVTELKSLADGRNQRVEMQAELPIRVRGNTDALAILIRNIVENAIHYSNVDDPIEIRVTRDVQHGILEVRDHGPGIRSESKQEVIQRFRRLPGTKSPGTGLGLSIVQRIAELHGGSLELLDAEVGSGLRVVVRIPIAE